MLCSHLVFQSVNFCSYCLRQIWYVVLWRCDRKWSLFFSSLVTVKNLVVIETRICEMNCHRSFKAPITYVFMLSVDKMTLCNKKEFLLMNPQTHHLTLWLPSALWNIFQIFGFCFVFVSPITSVWILDAVSSCFWQKIHINALHTTEVVCNA